MKILFYILGVLLVIFLSAFVIGLFRVKYTAENDSWITNCRSRLLYSKMGRPRVDWRVMKTSYKIDFCYSDGATYKFTYDVNNFGIGEIRGGMSLVVSK